MFHHLKKHLIKSNIDFQLAPLLQCCQTCHLHLQKSLYHAAYAASTRTSHSTSGTNFYHSLNYHSTSSMASASTPNCLPEHNSMEHSTLTRPQLSHMVPVYSLRTNHQLETHGHPTHWTDGTSELHSKATAVTPSEFGKPELLTSATQWHGSPHTSKCQLHQQTTSYSPVSKKSTTHSKIQTLLHLSPLSPITMSTNSNKLTKYLPTSTKKDVQRNHHKLHRQPMNKQYNVMNPKHHKYQSLN
mmetsp:Transcript_13271/g.19091  ORF Transcript_13271/g.19091 Transcript_13271/m.19091 type:complete len:243 (+) Transcript_13271:225-953(+)